MGAQGTADLNFGAFPGSSVAFVDVVATGVVSTSGVEAWIRPVATADHTDVDHIAAPLRIVGVFVSNDNIRIYGMSTSDLFSPDPPQTAPRVGIRPSPMFVGIFKVNWVWN